VSLWFILQFAFGSEATGASQHICHRKLIDIVQVAGLTPRLVCCEFDETRTPSIDAARMPLVFARH